MSFLPGMHPGFIAAAAELTTLSFFASSTSEIATITLPANIEAGDIIVLFDAGNEAGIPTSVVPTGFTSIFDVGTEIGVIDARRIASYKIAVGTEGGTNITGMNSGEMEKVALVFRGNIPVTSVNVADIATEATSGNPAAQVINASGGAVPLVLVGCVNSLTNLGASDSFSPAADAVVSTGADTNVYYKVYNSSPADHTLDMGDPGTGNFLGSFYMEAVAA